MEEESPEGDNVVFRYTRKQAVEDGILVCVGKFAGLDTVITMNLFNDGYEDEQKRLDLIKKGLALLAVPDPEDTDYMKIRVIEPGQLWVVLDGDGLCYMKPEDY